MTPTQDHPSTIEGALKWADVSSGCFETDPPTMDSVSLQTLADAYRSEKARADSLEKERDISQKSAGMAMRQYKELKDYGSEEGWYEYDGDIGAMLARHEAERKALCQST